MKARELAEILMHDPDLEVGLSVFGHSAFTEQTHGKIEIDKVRIHFSGGKTKDLVLVRNGLFPRSGYQPEKI